MLLPAHRLCHGHCFPPQSECVPLLKIPLMTSTPLYQHNCSMILCSMVTPHPAPSVRMTGIFSVALWMGSCGSGTFLTRRWRCGTRWTGRRALSPPPTSARTGSMLSLALMMAVASSMTQRYCAPPFREATFYISINFLTAFICSKKESICIFTDLFCSFSTLNTIPKSMCDLPEAGTELAARLLG